MNLAVEIAGILRFFRAEDCSRIGTVRWRSSSMCYNQIFLARGGAVR